MTRNSCVDLAGVEAGRRLVEDQHLGVEVDGPRDRDELLDGERVRAERGGDVEVEVEPGEQLGGTGARIRAQWIRPNRRGSRPMKMFSATDRLGQRLTSW